MATCIVRNGAESLSEMDITSLLRGIHKDVTIKLLCNDSCYNIKARLIEVSQNGIMVRKGALEPMAIIPKMLGQVRVDGKTIYENPLMRKGR